MTQHPRKKRSWTAKIIINKYIKYIHYEMFQQIETRMVLVFCRLHHFGYTFFIHQWNLRFSNCCLSPPFWKHVDHVFQGVRLKAHFRWPPRSRVISHWRHPNRTQHWWPIRCNSGWRRSSFLAVDSIQWFWCPLKHSCSQEFLVLCVFLLISFVSVFFPCGGWGNGKYGNLLFFLNFGGHVEPSQTCSSLESIQVTRYEYIYIYMGDPVPKWNSYPPLN